MNAHVRHYQSCEHSLEVAPAEFTPTDESPNEATSESATSGSPIEATSESTNEAHNH